VVDAVQIKQWSPSVEAQPHRGEEPHAPWLRGIAPPSWTVDWLGGYVVTASSWAICCS
jgi:hypothetical protein